MDSFCGRCLYFLNPNIIYLGLTAMTETLFMHLFVVSVFYFRKCFYLESIFFTSPTTDIDVKSRAHFFSIDDPYQTFEVNYDLFNTNNLLKSFSLFFSPSTND
jgi:hypothetical protein